jgi:hypothetical protein
VHCSLQLAVNLLYNDQAGKPCHGWLDEMARSLEVTLSGYISDPRDHALHVATVCMVPVIRYLTQHMYILYFIHIWPLNPQPCRKHHRSGLQGAAACRLQRSTGIPCARDCRENWAAGLAARPLSGCQLLVAGKATVAYNAGHETTHAFAFELRATLCPSIGAYIPTT